MNKILLIFISYFLIGCGKSPDWKIYHQSTGKTILIDESSIKKKGEYVSFWYVSDLKMYPNLHFLWKEVYNCKTQMSMSLYYDVVQSVSSLPNNIPDLTDEDRWLKISDDNWDRNVFNKFCGDKVKKTFF